MEGVNLLSEIAVHNAYLTDVRGFGGPDRDRTDDLFHAMENQQLTAQTAKELLAGKAVKTGTVGANWHQIDTVGAKVKQRLEGWKKTHPTVGDVRGRGLMIGVELVKDKSTREPAAAVRNRVEVLAFERGLMILGCGENTLRLCPPLIITEDEAMVALDILEDALTAAENEHLPAAELAAVAATAGDGA
jgi:Aminotransferase class-III